jgi:hypothetical protein
MLLLHETWETLFGISENPESTDLLSNRTDDYSGNSKYTVRNIVNILTGPMFYSEKYGNYFEKENTKPGIGRLFYLRTDNVM